MRRRISWLLIAGSALLAVGCGGGGSGGAPPSGGGGGGGSGSGWVAGVFAPASNYKDRCLDPRAGIDPSTGNPYPDMQGLTLDENNWLRSWSDETYLWYDEIVDVDPGNYGNPISYFDRLKTFGRTIDNTPKDNFHFTFDTAQWIALSQSGVSFGYGATWVTLAAEPPRDVAIAFSEPGTPAGDGGLERGDRIVTVDGWDVVNDDTVTGVNAINAGLYPETDGEMHTFGIEDLETGIVTDVVLTAGSYASVPVQHTGTVMSPMGATVGYLLFNDHIATAEQGLIDAIDTLAQVPGGIDDLVVDLRYNVGGYLVIASQFAYMVAGPVQTQSRIFELSEFNDKHPTTNPVTGSPIVPLPFVDVTVGLSAPVTDPVTILPSLDLQRVFVLTSDLTCSASEAIINGLRGIGVEVIQIGETTCGKPYGFYPSDNCGTTYFTIQLRGTNDAGFGDYSDGFTPADGGATSDTRPPGCIVADDFGHRFADPDEAQLATALHYLDNGSCPVVPLSATGPGFSKTLSEPQAPSIRRPQALSNRILLP